MSDLRWRKWSHENDNEDKGTLTTALVYCEQCKDIVEQKSVTSIEKSIVKYRCYKGHENILQFRDKAK